MYQMIHFLQGGEFLNIGDILILKNTFLFADESDSDIIEFADSADCTLSEFHKGDTVFGDEATKNHLGILLSGRATALCADCSASSLKTFVKGDLFGAANVFCDKAHNPFSKIEAKGPCRVLFISSEGIERLILAKPEKAISYIRFLSGRVEFLNKRISTFTANQTLERVAKFILENADENGICHGVNFSALAKSLDISRASLYRAKTELINSNAISQTGRDILILDREALKNII